MTQTRKLLLLPGDGIGPEVMAETVRVIDWLGAQRGVAFDVEEDLVGGCAFDAHGHPAPPAMITKAREADAVLMGAVGGPQWADVEYANRPEQGLLDLRVNLGLFANLRPAICFDALKDASSLKPELVSGLDILIVRELIGGIYFGKPAAIEDLGNGQRRGVNTQIYTSAEIRRVARVAFELAGARGGRLTSVDKANVMISGLLWREEVQKIGETEYPAVSLDHMYADNCAMQLVRAPKQFDVIVTDNLFGDMLSDEAAMLTGSLGMLPSASLGAKDKNGKAHALYEPVHGSAPDIAGAGKANPIAMILSLVMALRYSFDLAAEAVLIDQAVNAVLARGLRTADIAGPGEAALSTRAMGDAILNELNALNAGTEQRSRNDVL